MKVNSNGKGALIEDGYHFRGLWTLRVLDNQCMANRYGEAALMAVRMETYGKALTAADRW